MVPAAVPKEYLHALDVARIALSMSTAASETALLASALAKSKTGIASAWERKSSRWRVDNSQSRCGVDASVTDRGAEAGVHWG